MGSFERHGRSLPVNCNLQALRAFAAYGVVVHHIITGSDHYFGNGRIFVDVTMGASGVQIFFVISGYLMAATTDASGIRPGAFLRNRIIRIVPSYWLLTLFGAFVLFLGHRLFGIDSFEPGFVARSLFFIPNIDGAGGYRSPLIFVGWTLEFEMMFYMFFFISLFIPDLKARKIAVAALLIALVAAGHVSENAYLIHLGRVIVLAFLLGIVIRAVENRLEIPGPAALMLTALALFGLASVDVFPHVVRQPSGAGIIIASAALLVYSVVQLERRGWSVGNGFFAFQGDASYAVYLIHPFAIQFVGRAAIDTGMNTSTTRLAITIIAMFVISGVAGTVFHFYFEKPMIAWLKKRHPRRALFSRSRMA